MNRWNTSWLLLKDAALTGTGLVLILSQIFSGHPSDVLLVTGLALTVPSAAGHVKEVLTGPIAGRSSPSSRSPGAPPSSSSSPE